MLGSHLLTLLTFSALVSVFFATLSKETPREAVKVCALMLSMMIGLSILAAWLMYFFPLG